METAIQTANDTAKKPKLVWEFTLNMEGKMQKLRCLETNGVKNVFLRKTPSHAVWLGIIEEERK